jgi:hypothetical protein
MFLVKLSSKVHILKASFRMWQRIQNDNGWTFYGKLIGIEN